VGTRDTGPYIYISNIENQNIFDVNLSVFCWVKWKFNVLFMFSQHAKAKVLAASFNSIFASLSIPGAKKLLRSSQQRARGGTSPLLASNLDNKAYADICSMNLPQNIPEL